MVHRVFVRGFRPLPRPLQRSHFNYLGHIFGFWRSFCTINQAVPPTGESLADVKTMIYVIGISYSTEYAIKGLYENTIGRVFEWIRGEERTPQDIFARAMPRTIPRSSTPSPGTNIRFAKNSMA